MKKAKSVVLCSTENKKLKMSTTKQPSVLQKQRGVLQLNKLNIIVLRLFVVAVVHVVLQNTYRRLKNKKNKNKAPEKIEFDTIYLNGELNLIIPVSQAKRLELTYKTKKK